MPKLGYRWNLRMLMAAADMFATTDLVSLLTERGVVLSVTQVYRLVTQTPERLSLRTPDGPLRHPRCTPNDLIEPVTAAAPRRKATAAGSASASSLKGRRPRRAEITER